MADEAALLRRHARDTVLARTLGPAPDTSYRPVARAPAHLPKRPVVIGTGPCGIFAALIDTYQDLLVEIERRGGDVFRERVRIPSWRKIARLAGAFPRRWGWW